MSDPAISVPGPVAPAPRAGERGVALVMAMIFSILLYILVAELVVSSRMVRATGENDALLARMRGQMLFQLQEAEDKLLNDLAGAAAGDDGGLGGALAGAMPDPGAAAGAPGAAGDGLGGEEQEEDPTSKCDSSRDAWYEPIGNADNDLTTYVWIEDENRKLNLLALWSADEEFAQTSRDRLVRLIDGLREDTEFDVSSSDATRIAQDIIDWGQRPGTDQMPTPLLKSRDEQRQDLVVPLHLDELMMLSSVSEELFFDKVLDGRVYLGLESVLTLWTSVQPDPGSPEKVARQRAAAEARGETVPEPAAEETAGQEGDEQSPPQPEGEGIRINVNTASRAVLRALFPPERVPDRVIDAIIRYRNEIDEEATEAAAEDSEAEASDFGDMQLGTQTLLQFFETTGDLEQVEEFAELPDEEVKAEILAALTTKSDVFSIHLATLYKRNEENRIYLLRRSRSIVMRIDDGAEGQVVPLIPFEERIGLRLQPIDLQEEQELLRDEQYLDMDQFAKEERAWNPFLVDFYLPKDERDRFYEAR